jgi:hypothetical protein
MCVTADTSAQDALNLMVSRGFRHLVNELIWAEMNETTMTDIFTELAASL